MLILPGAFLLHTEKQINMTLNRSFLMVLLLAATGVQVFGQRQVSKSNVLFGPFFKSIRTSQEVKVAPRLTTQTTAKVRPASTFHGFGAGRVEVEGQAYNPFSNTKLSTAGNSTEFRIYSRKKGAMRGFYFGPYFSYTFAKLTSGAVPASFKDSNGATHTADLQQVIKVNLTGGGLQMGTQALIKNRVCIDWTILGFGFGSFSLKGGVEATNMSSDFDFRNYTEDVNNVSFGIEKIFRLEKTVEKESITLGAKFPCPLLRMGVSVGFAYGGMKKPALPKNDGGNDSTAPAGSMPGTNGKYEQQKNQSVPEIPKQDPPKPEEKKEEKKDDPKQPK